MVMVWGMMMLKLTRLPQLLVLNHQFIQLAFEEVDAVPLGLDKALLVLNDSRQFLQIQHRLDRVLQ